MKMNKKAVAVLMTAVLAAGVVAAGSGRITARAEEQQTIPTGQFKLPDMELKEGQGAEFDIPAYEKGISFMYTSSNTKAVIVDGKGSLEPGSYVITGEAVVTVKTMYNFMAVNQKEYELKLEKENDRFFITDKDGNEITSVAESGVRYELTMEDESVAAVTFDGKKARITGVKAGETTMTLIGYIGNTAFGSGSCKILVTANGNKPQESVTPPTESEEPADTPLPQQRVECDADGNGKVELADAQQVLKAALKIDEITDEAIITAVDADGNGKLELADAQYILKKALKII